MSLLERCGELVSEAMQHAADDGVRAALDDASSRLAAPLRIALIGRAKSGKSTLLNALVGDLVAPTDAAECTLLPTEYHGGIAYRSWKVTLDGEILPARFRRDDGGAHIELDGTGPADLVRLLVEFPSPLLQTMTIVDTPGLGSVNEVVSQRTVDFTSNAEMAPADAVVYLVRSWHAVDSDFLAGFHNRVGVDVPPVNALAALSRADEIGGGDADALEQAGALARAMSSDSTLRSLVVRVLPVAGLLAETAATLTESEFQALAAVACQPAADRHEALLSVDRFTAADRLAGVPQESRLRLAGRLGMFGLRFGIGEIDAGRVRSADDLCTALQAASGLDALRSAIFDELAGRAATMRGARVLDLIDDMLNDGRLHWDDALASSLERIRVNAFEIAELGALNELLCSPSLGFGTATRTEAALLLGADGAAPRARLHLADDAPAALVRDGLRGEIARWQARATSDASLPQEQRLARVVVRSLTHVLAAFTG